jgi:hypothetical protein
MSRKRQFTEESGPASLAYANKELATANFCCTNVITNECRSLATAQKLYPDEKFDAKDDRCYPSASRCQSQCKLPDVAWDLIMEAQPNVDWQKALTLQPGQKLGSYSAKSLQAQAFFEECMELDPSSKNYMTDVHDKLVSIVYLLKFRYVRITHELFVSLLHKLMFWITDLRVSKKGHDPDYATDDVGALLSMFWELVSIVPGSEQDIRTEGYLLESFPMGIGHKSDSIKTFFNSLRYEFSVREYETQLTDVIQRFLQRYEQYDWNLVTARNLHILEAEDLIHPPKVLGPLPTNFVLALAKTALARSQPFDYSFVVELNEHVERWNFLIALRKSFVQNPLIADKVKSLPALLKEYNRYQLLLKHIVATDYEKQRAEDRLAVLKEQIQRIRFLAELDFLVKSEEFRDAEEEAKIEEQAYRVLDLLPDVKDEKEIKSTQQTDVARKQTDVAPNQTDVAPKQTALAEAEQTIPFFPADVLRTIGEYSANIFPAYEQKKEGALIRILEDLQTFMHETTFLQLWDRWTCLLMVLRYDSAVATINQIYRIVSFLSQLLDSIKTLPVTDTELKMRGESFDMVAAEKRFANVVPRVEEVFVIIYQLYPALLQSFDFYRFVIEEMSKVKNFEDVIEDLDITVPGNFLFPAPRELYLQPDGKGVSLVDYAFSWIESEFISSIVYELSGLNKDKYSDEVSLTETIFINARDASTKINKPFWTTVFEKFEAAFTETAIKRFPKIFPFKLYVSHLFFSLDDPHIVKLLLETLPTWLYSLNTIIERQSEAIEERTKRRNELMQEIKDMRADRPVLTRRVGVVESGEDESEEEDEGEDEQSEDEEEDEPQNVGGRGVSKEAKQKLQKQLSEYLPLLFALYAQYAMLIAPDAQIAYTKEFVNEFFRLVDNEMQTIAMERNDPRDVVLVSQARQYLARRDMYRREQERQAQPGLQFGERPRHIPVEFHERKRNEVVGLNPRNLLPLPPLQMPAPAAAMAQYPRPLGAPAPAAAMAQYPAAAMAQYPRPGQTRGGFVRIFSKSTLLRQKF